MYVGPRKAVRWIVHLHHCRLVIGGRGLDASWSSVPLQKSPEGVAVSCWWGAKGLHVVSSLKIPGNKTLMGPDIIGPARAYKHIIGHARTYKPRPLTIYPRGSSV